LLAKQQRDHIIGEQRQMVKAELEKNAEAKKQLIEDFKQAMVNTSLAPAEQTAMLVEMNSKIAQLNDMVLQEEKTQNDMLEDALAKRRAKKKQVKDLVYVVAEKKAQIDDFFTKKMNELADSEQKEITALEPAIEKEKENLVSKVKAALERKRLMLLGDSEKRLNDFRKRMTVEEEANFAEMLA
jgi:predicted nuclease with TOPRIM domain